MSILTTLSRRGPFLRRRDLLAFGHNDREIRAALRAHLIFRVRHGWYAVPTAVTDAAAQAIRVGGRLTGRSALMSYGLRIPRPPRVQLAVPRNACRLRRPTDKAERLTVDDGLEIVWVDAPRLSTDPSTWRMSIDDALVAVLNSESRDIAVACCDAVMRYRGWSWSRLDRVFARARVRARKWRALVVHNSDSHGETYVRLWCADARLPFEAQPRVPGVGRLDGRISAHVYVEIDGAQHAEEWDDDDVPSSFEHDHDRDAVMTIGGDRVLRFTYRQIRTAWTTCLAAMDRAVADDLALARYRARHPYVPRVRSKRRRSRRKAPATDSNATFASGSPSF